MNAQLYFTYVYKTIFDVVSFIEYLNMLLTKDNVLKL